MGSTSPEVIHLTEKAPAAPTFTEIQGTPARSQPDVEVKNYSNSKPFNPRARSSTTPRAEKEGYGYKKPEGPKLKYQGRRQGSKTTTKKYEAPVNFVTPSPVKPPAQSYQSFPVIESTMQQDLMGYFQAEKSAAPNFVTPQPAYNPSPAQQPAQSPSLQPAPPPQPAFQPAPAPPPQRPVYQLAPSPQPAFQPAPAPPPQQPVYQLAPSPQPDFQPAPSSPQQPVYQPASPQPTFQPAPQQPEYQPAPAPQPSFQPAPQPMLPVYQSVTAPMNTPTPSYQPSSQPSLPSAPTSQPPLIQSTLETALAPQEPRTIFMSPPKPVRPGYSPSQTFSQSSGSIFVTPSSMTTTQPPIFIPPKKPFKPIVRVRMESTTSKKVTTKLTTKTTSAPLAFSTLLPPIREGVPNTPKPTGFLGLIEGGLPKRKELTSYKNNAPAPFVGFSDDVIEPLDKEGTTDGYGTPSADVITTENDDEYGTPFAGVITTENNDEYGSPRAEVITTTIRNQNKVPFLPTVIQDQTTTFVDLLTPPKQQTYFPPRQPIITSTAEQVVFIIIIKIEIKI